QFELIKILGGSRPNLCVVGDDDQSIYGWRGARVENIFRFREAFEGTKVFRLEQNYRSTQPILELAHSVVSRSTMREDKKLWTEKKEGKKPEVIRLSTEADEAGEVVDRIGREVLSGKREYRDYAILYRTNAQSRLFEDALRSRRFPYQVIGSLRFYDRKEIRDALAYFKICINPRDDVSLRRIISEPPRGIGTTTLDHLVEWSRANDTTLTKALINGEVVEGLSSRGANNCRKFGEQIENWRNELKEKKLNEWAKWVLEDSGYIRRLEDGDKFENATRLDNINELISGLAQFEEEADESENGLADFVEQVALATDIDKYDPEADSVRMMTIHSAKGLEFPVVFVTGLEKGLFPFERMGDSDYDPDEERRLFYVAVTRAEKELILTMAWQRRKWGVLSGCAPSPFLKELPREFISESGTSSPYAAKQGSLGFGSSRDRNSKKAVSSFRKTNTSSSQKQETISPDDIPAIHYGDLVRHKVFGDGMVVNAVKYRNDIKVTVEFEDGQHDLLQSKAKLQPLKDF
ncbi:MAG: 3'-5' exonuclease, partial [Candidatus Electryonea clarkiae]|nr:3'-5' exonuclease [Candidatus Electryonea clarkiae]